MQWKGLHPIVRHDNGVDCLVKVHGKVELYYINKLKKYTIRKTDYVPRNEISQVYDSDQKDSGKCDSSMLENSTDTKFDISPDLSDNQTQELNKQFSKYVDLFSDEPGLTNTITHGIKLISNDSPHNKSYRVSQSKLKTSKEELDRMLYLVLLNPLTPHTARQLY